MRLLLIGSLLVIILLYAGTTVFLGLKLDSLEARVAELEAKAGSYETKNKLNDLQRQIYSLQSDVAGLKFSQGY